MEFEIWQEDIINKAKRQIMFNNNMSSSQKDFDTILFDYLDNGIKIVKQRRKLQDDTEFVTGNYDSILIQYIKDKYASAGREMFNDYNSGGVSAKFVLSAEDRLKASCKQVM